MKNLIKRLTFFVFGFLAIAPVHSQSLTGYEIIRNVEENYVSSTQIGTTTMVINGSRSTRELTSKVWSDGENVLIEYLSPARDRGTKMLRQGDQLWIYYPRADRVITIAGHMLNQSMMGSDSSYEDFMEQPELTEQYDIQLVGEEKYSGRDTYVLELIAKEGSGAAYHIRKMWVDKERFIPLQSELFAKSGTLLKRMKSEEVFFVNGRWLPKRRSIKDMSIKGDGTQIIINEIEFDQDIPAYLFSKAALRR